MQLNTLEVETDLSSSEELYSDQILQSLDPSRIPQHVALIMDGNRRWAKQKGLNVLAGHKKGADVLIQITKAAAELGIQALTVYAFSTENWSRSPHEVLGLMRLIKHSLIEKRPVMLREGVRLQTIGRLEALPEDLQKTIQETKEITKIGDRIDLVLAINYGGRDDICRAVKHLMVDCKEGRIQMEQLSEDLFSSYLDTARWPDPSLMIRTSGEKRLSNFLLWQLSYSEVLLSNILWPDFTEWDFLEAIREYQRRELRTGR